MSTQEFIDELVELFACESALRWVRANNHLTPQELWDICDRGDWMLWLLGKLSGPPGSESRKKLAHCAADIAELALPIWEAKYPNDDRPRKAIEAARRGSPKECKEACRAAYAAAYCAAAADAATYAAVDVTADAAAVAAAAAYAARAAYAADAAYTAAAAAAAAVDAARKGQLAKSADIVRKSYPVIPNTI